MQVILISSKETGQRSGKSTFVKTFRKYSPINIITEEYEFSYPIKKIVHEVFGIPMEILYSDEKETPCGVPIAGITDNASPRQLMQIVGTELFRNHFYQEIWVDNAYRKIVDFEKTTSGSKSYLLIGDWRFDNEFTFLRDRGVDCLRIDIVRPNNPFKKSNHASEKSITLSNDDYDYIIRNDFDLYRFEQTCREYSEVIVSTNK